MWDSYSCHSCESRNPFLMVPCFRRDTVWIPVFTEMTNGLPVYGTQSALKILNSPACFVYRFEGVHLVEMICFHEIIRNERS